MNTNMEDLILPNAAYEPSEQKTSTRVTKVLPVLLLMID